MSSSRRGRGEGWQMAKSVAVWTVLLLGSFAFGLFVISPLINVASGANADTQAKPAATQTQAPAPAPEPIRHSARATVTPPVNSPPKRDAAPEIRLGPEDSPTIQSPDALDSSHDSEHPRRRRHRPSPSEENAQPPDTAAQDNPSGEGVSTDHPGITDAVATGDQPSEEPKPKRRRRRARSSVTSTETQSGRRTRSDQGKESRTPPAEKSIQKGESIDN